VTITATGATSGIAGEYDIYVQNFIPNFDEWLGSAHAKVDAEAFNHWNGDGAVPAACARCHTTPGFQDYTGADGTAFETMEAATHPIGTTIECQACHNDVANELDVVTFPSGVVVEDLGPEARCMTCHQGRSSSDAVENKIVEAAVGDDEVSAALSFQNIHYYAAGATLYAGRVRGGYQYAEQTYDWRFRHVPERDTCIGCHDQHTLQIRVDECATCHTDVEAVEDVRDIRMMASLHTDYDGDGDREEGVYYEVAGMRERLFATIQQYTEDKGFGSVCYDPVAYPYWFIDTDADGACSPTEAVIENKYASWTPRLVRAAYNFQVATKDPGAFAHNAKYTIQLLHDATMDLNDALTAPADLSALEREDPGHFNGAGEPARHWDADEEVSGSCSKCHGGSEGFRFFLEHGVGTPVAEPDNGLDCATCHEDFVDFTTVEVASVTFPGGTVHEFAESETNLCGTCHSGRTGMADIDARIATGRFAFLNVHYRPAAGIRAGSDGNVGYEYPLHDYSGEFSGHMGGDGCVDCHQPGDSEHTFDVNNVVENCASCHRNIDEPTDIRASRHAGRDYDGDANATEPMAGEIAGLEAALLAELRTDGLCYNGAAYPYFFAAGSGSPANGQCAGGEGSFRSWSPALMKAAHNYQFVHKEYGSWAHNFDYAAQLLIDSIEDLGGNTSGFVRPTAN
jgi:hypothetical protein